MPFFFSLHPFLFFNPQKERLDAIFHWLCSKHFWLIRNSESITLMNWSRLPAHLCSAQWRPFGIFAVIYLGKPEHSSSKKALWLISITAIINEAAFISSLAPPSTYEQWSPLMVHFVYHRQLFPLLFLRLCFLRCRNEACSFTNIKVFAPNCSRMAHFGRGLPGERDLYLQTELQMI